ncbi:MAG: sulfotransferase [Porticoccaceae bacterium]
MLTGLIHKIGKKIPHIRRTRCFCLGAAKTGTTSFAAMFAACYRSAHEPQPEKLTVAIEKVITGIWRDGEVAAWLEARDRELNLEVEASHPLGYVARWLPELFPQARFVITLRDPLPWLKSRLNFHYHKSPPEWLRYRDLIWSRWHKGYNPEELVLEEMGLYSIDAYLAQYAEQYQLLFRDLPEERTLLLRTDELSESIDRIASFLGIDPRTITRQHQNAFTAEDSVIDFLPEDFVARRVDHHCGWLREYL